MSDSDKTLKLNIEIDKTGTGGQQAQAEIQALTDETVAYQAKLKEMAGKDDDTAKWDDLHAKAQAYSASVQDAAAKQKIFDDALGEFKTRAQEGAEGVQDVEKRAASLRGVLSEVNKILPESGHLLHAAFEGAVIGAVFAAAMAVADLKREIDEFNNSLDTLAENNAAPEFLDNITGRMQVLAGAAAENQSFADGLNKIAAANNNLNTALTDQLNLYSAIERAKAAQTSADKALEIAKLQLAEGSGQITPEQAAEKRVAIEKKYNLQKQADIEASQDAEVAAKQAALTQAQKEEAGRIAVRNTTADQVTKDQLHDKGVNSAEGAILAAIANLQKRFAREDELGNRTWDWLSNDEQGEYRGLKDSHGETQAAIDRLRRRLNQFDETQKGPWAAAEKADSDAATVAQQKAEEGAKTITDLTHALQELNRTILATRGQQEQTVATENQTVDVNEQTRITKQFEADARKLQQFARSKNPTIEMNANIQKVIQDVLGMLQDHNDILKTLPDYGAAIANLQRDTAEVKNQIANQRNFFGNP